MAVTRSQFAPLFAPGIRKVMEQNMSLPQTYEEIYNIESSDRQFETSLGITGFGAVPQKAEGSPVRYDSPLLVNPKVVYNLTYALGFRITREAGQDDLYGKVGKNMANALTRSARYTKEVLGAAPFNNGFSATDFGADGVSIFNAAHPLAGGGFYGNRPSTPTALSQTSLQAALTQFAKTPDDRGIIQNNRAAWLVVPPELEFYALELVKSSLKPDGTQNNINSVQGIVNVLVWPYLTNPTAWFLVGEKTAQNLVWYNRINNEIEDSYDFSTKDDLYSIYFRCSSAATDFRGLWGNPGS